MTKLLSIIIPTYNMEALLPSCLKSVTDCRRRDLIQIIAVNDGSTDSSLEIMQNFRSKYPDSVTVIDKSNGNYGSAINAALPKAEGEYVRILDADDTYDTAQLEAFIDFLESSPKVDMIVSPYIEDNGQARRLIHYDTYSRPIYDSGVEYNLDEIFADNDIHFFMMHGITYRTDLLRDINYRQTEGISYTDQEWVFYPLFDAKTVMFSEDAVYIYNIAREGRTMDPSVQMKCIGQVVTVTGNMALKLRDSKFSSMTTARTEFLQGVVERRLKFIYRKFLLEMDEQTFRDSNFELYDRHLQILADACGILNLKVYPNPYLKIDLLAKWNRNQRRLPEWRIKMISRMNDTMFRLYNSLFR